MRLELKLRLNGSGLFIHEIDNVPCIICSGFPALLSLSRLCPYPTGEKIGMRCSLATTECIGFRAAFGDNFEHLTTGAATKALLVLCQRIFARESASTMIAHMRSFTSVKLGMTFEVLQFSKSSLIEGAQERPLLRMCQEVSPEIFLVC